MDQILDFPSAANHAGGLPPELDGLRRSAPVSRVRLPDGRVAWLVTRHEHVSTVLAGGQFTRDTTGPGPGAMRTVNMDGAPHQELRGVVSRAFTVRQIENLRPRVRELTDRLLDRMAAAGPPADLVRHLAAPLPGIVICEMLGFPAGDHDRLAAWCDRITAVHAGGLDQAAWRELGGYVEGALRRPRRPDGDLLATLAEAENDGRITRPELISLAIVILAGGLETTRTAISAGVLRLLEHPAQLARLRADPHLIGAAVEEMIRFQPVVDLNRLQVATADVWLGDQLVRTGDLVQVSVNAANRDEDVFPGGAEFDIGRRPNPHLAFGHGAHRCLGAALARVELGTVLAALLRRFPALDLAVPAENLRWRGGHVAVGLEELPVTW